MQDGLSEFIERQLRERCGLFREVLALLSPARDVGRADRSGGPQHVGDVRDLDGSRRRRRIGHVRDDGGKMLDRLAALADAGTKSLRHSPTRPVS